MLPIHEIRNDLLAAAAQPGAQLLLAAPTGSGKSTQVPQYLADAGVIPGQILILQPRRLAARMLANRVATERGQAVGGEVGYQTRFDSRISEATRIRFITEGILPRLLLADPTLGGIGAVLFDEFHERSLTVDLGLALARRVQETHRPDLRLLVMSATLDTAALAAYLPRACGLRAEGRLHPVEIRYAGGTARTPVWDRAAEALAGLLMAGAGGDVLIFMPGAHEIRRTLDACRHRLGGADTLLLPLYGDLPPDQQDLVMRPAAGRRKVIVATNIAETSLTIPGVRHVIDSGLARIGRHDAGRGFNTLFVEAVSRAGADQRAGRAGREGPGICVRLWSQLEQNHRPAHDVPEVRRIDLAEAVLLLRTLGVADTRAFPWFEAPPAAALEAAERGLRDLGALDPVTGALTEQGARLAKLPAHPRLARLLDEAARRGCLREAALVAALLSERAPAAPPAAAGPRRRAGGADEPA
ncbi:MAG: helicase-related protein, partial [Lentisphaeria bacterium]